MTDTPEPFTKQTIEHKGHKVELVWDGRYLMIHADADRCVVVSVNDLSLNPLGNVVIEFTDWIEDEYHPAKAFRKVRPPDTEVDRGPEGSSLPTS